MIILYGTYCLNLPSRTRAVGYSLSRSTQRYTKTALPLKLFSEADCLICVLIALIHIAKVIKQLLNTLKSYSQ